MRSGSGQQGVVLFLTLTILLLMTVTGLASVQVTMMQERLSRNYLDVSMAFQAAESAAREAEAFIEAARDIDTFPGVDAIPGCVRGLCNSLDGVERWTMVDWSDDSLDYLSAVSAAGLGTAKAPGFIIEYVARSTMEPHSPVIENVGGDRISGMTRIFRITARGTGGSGQAHAMVQLIYGRKF